MNNSFIYLHRKILSWQWFQKPEMVQLFIYLLIDANYSEKKWQGISIKKGQLVTSRERISRDLKMSIQNVRTCLNRLKSTNEITIKTTNRYTLLTICNYDQYQTYNKNINQQTTNSQPTNNQQITTTNNINNINKDNNINVCIGESQIFNSILSFFGFTPQNNPDKATQVSHFVNTLLQNGQLEHFKSQFEAYKEYKAKTAEKTHGFGSFFGEQVQSYTKNGGWNAQNWKNKLKQAENKTATGSPRPGPEKKPMTKL